MTVTALQPIQSIEATGSAREASDAIQDARRALAEVVKGIGGRNSMARVSAAKIILAKDFLAYLTDEDLLAEVKRRGEASRAGE